MQLWNIFPLLVLLSDTISSDVLRVKWSTWKQKTDFSWLQQQKIHPGDTQQGSVWGIHCSAQCLSSDWNLGDLNGENPWKSQLAQLAVLQGPGREGWAGFTQEITDTHLQLSCFKKS